MSRLTSILKLWSKSRFLFSPCFITFIFFVSKIPETFACNLSICPFYFIIYSANLSPSANFYWSLLSTFLICFWIYSYSANLIDLTTFVVLVLNPLEAETDSSNLSSSLGFFKYLLLLLLFKASSEMLAYSNIYS